LSQRSFFLGKNSVLKISHGLERFISKNAYTPIFIGSFEIFRGKKIGNPTTFDAYSQT